MNIFNVSSCLLTVGRCCRLLLKTLYLLTKVTNYGIILTEILNCRTPVDRCYFIWHRGSLEDIICKTAIMSCCSPSYCSVFHFPCFSLQKQRHFAVKQLCLTISSLMFLPGTSALTHREKPNHNPEANRGRKMTVDKRNGISME